MQANLLPEQKVVDPVSGEEANLKIIGKASGRLHLRSNSHQANSMSDLERTQNKGDTTEMRGNYQKIAYRRNMKDLLETAGELLQISHIPKVEKKNKIEKTNQNLLKPIVKDLSNNKIAILDRHILRNLVNYNIIPETKIKNKKDYFEKEKLFLKFSQEINIPLDEIDLLFWQRETGEIFK